MLKNIKNYAMALGAFAIAATSATLMSFGKKVADPFYPMVNGVYQSTPLNPLDEGNLWKCTPSKISDCSAQFSTPPSATHQTPTGEIRKGVFEEL